MLNWLVASGISTYMVLCCMFLINIYNKENGMCILIVFLLYSYCIDSDSSNSSSSSSSSDIV